MAYYFGGNNLPLHPGAAYNSTNNLAGGFPLVGHNTMRLNGGAYGTTTYGGPMNGGALNAPPQPISMGYSGLPQPMLVGMTTGQYMRQPVAQYLYPAARGIPMANGPRHAPMPYDNGTYQNVPGTYHPGISMASAPQNAHMAYGMRPNGAYSRGTLVGAMNPLALVEQRPAPLVAPAHNVGHGDASHALPRMPVVRVPAQQVAAQAEVIDLTNDSDDEPIAISNTPVTQRASNKKRSAESTPKSAGKPVKKPRYSRFTGDSALPTPPISSPVVHTTPVPSVPALSSSGSSVSPAVLPATPSSVSPTPAPRKRRADPNNLLGDVYHTFMRQPVNARTADPEVERIVRPVYGRFARKTVARSRTPEPVVESIETAVAGSSTSEAHVAEGDTNSESDADFEVDDEYVVHPAAVPAAVTPAANAATDDVAEDDQLVVDESGTVLVDAEGMPLKRSVWLAQQAAANELELVETSGTSDPAELAERLDASLLAAAETARQVAETVAAAEESTSRTKKSKKAAAPKKTAAPKKKRSPAPKKPLSSAPKKSAASASKKRSPSPVAESDNQLELEAGLQASFDEEPAEEETAAAAAHEQELQTVRELKARLARVSTKDELDEMMFAYHCAWIRVDKRAGPIEEAYAEARQVEADWPESEDES